MWAVGTTYDLQPVNVTRATFSNRSDVVVSELRFTIYPSPEGLQINPSTGSIHFTPRAVGMTTGNVYAQLRDYSDVLIGTITFDFRYSDTENVLAVGPNNRNCANGGKKVEDGVELNLAYACSCAATTFSGENCADSSAAGAAGATPLAYDVAEVSGIVEGLTCDQMKLQVNIDTIAAAAINGMVAAGVDRDNVVSYSVRVCPTSMRRQRREPTAPYEVEVVLADTADAVLDTITAVAASNTLLAATAKFVGEADAALSAVATTATGTKQALPAVGKSATGTVTRAALEMMPTDEMAKSLNALSEVEKRGKLDEIADAVLEAAGGALTAADVYLTELLCRATGLAATCAGGRRNLRDNTQMHYLIRVIFKASASGSPGEGYC